MPRRWPVELRGASPSGELVVLRPLRRSDRRVFGEVRRDNEAWLGPWEATVPDQSPVDQSAGFRGFVRRLDAEARAGRMLPFVIEVGGALCGQVTLSTIVMGSFRSCTAGYWVSRRVAGRSIAPTALALAGDHGFRDVGLHRLEVNIRPENAASLAVVAKLGFRDEGVRRRYLHIDGSWRDHRSFALTTEDLAGGTLRERLAHWSRQSHPRHTDTGPR